MSLNESFSDYFSCAQTEDGDIGEWLFINPNNVRHLDIQRNMSQFDMVDQHANGQIYSCSHFIENEIICYIIKIIFNPFIVTYKQGIFSIFLPLNLLILFLNINHRLS